jgi:hypothetical protein
MFWRAMITNKGLLSIVTHLHQFFKLGFDSLVISALGLLISKVAFILLRYESVRSRRQTIVARTLDGSNR